MHRDLEHVGNRIHNIRMRAVREDVLDPLVKVFITVGIAISLCRLTRDRMHLRQRDDFRIFVTNMRQDAVEDLRFDIINLRGSENGTDECSRKEGSGRVANPQQSEGDLREVPPLSRPGFPRRVRIRIGILEEFLESLRCGGERDQGQEIAQGIVVDRIIG